MSLNEDEFYCGSEESEKERINPFRQKPEKPTNALREAIDRALGKFPCGTEENPHVIEINPERISRLLYYGKEDLDLNKVELRCTKCEKLVPKTHARIPSITMEIVEKKPARSYTGLRQNDE